MFNPISKWVVKVRKSYINLFFQFQTAEGASDFYEVLRSAYVEDKDEDKVSVEVYAEYDEGEDE